MGITSNFFEHSRITDLVDGRNFMSRNVITILYGLLVALVVLHVLLMWGNCGWLRDARASSYIDGL